MNRNSAGRFLLVLMVCSLLAFPVLAGCSCTTPGYTPPVSQGNTAGQEISLIATKTARYNTPLQVTGATALTVSPGLSVSPASNPALFSRLWTPPSVKQAPVQANRTPVTPKFTPLPTRKKTASRP